MVAMRIHATFQNNFVSILDKHAPKKTKTYARIKNHNLLRTFGSK